MVVWPSTKVKKKKKFATRPGTYVLTVEKKGEQVLRRVLFLVDDEITVRPMMYLAVSYDHRIINGREAVTFLKRIVECIEHPERMLLEI